MSQLRFILGVLVITFAVVITIIWEKVTDKIGVR
jgi:hypothetical protein